MVTSQRQLTELHEGRVNHAYRDSEGYWTVGVGRLIDSRKGGFLPAWLTAELAPNVRMEFSRLVYLPDTIKRNRLAVLTDAQVDRLYTEDLERHQGELRRLQPWVAKQLDPVRAAVLDDMCFNMGTEPFDGDGVKDWPNFLSQVKTGKYKEAAANMCGTLWARQVGTRAARLAAMMETGQWPQK